MKKFDLTAQQLKTVLHYNPETGVFTRIKRTCNRVKVGQVCGSPNTNGYLQISVGNHLYLASHLAVLYMTGRWPAEQVDHRNTVKTDNRWTNLREVSNAVNAQNRRSARKSSKSGVLGVSPVGNKWAATIGLNKKKLHLGLFPTIHQAGAVYVETKRLIHPGNTL